MEKRTELSGPITLYHEGIERTFTITNTISNQGGSVITYEAYHEQSGKGVLREFYPLYPETLYYVLKRDNQGYLSPLEGLDYAFEAFEKEKQHYLAPFHQLLKIKQDHPFGNDLGTFIPHFEIYTTGKTNGTVYIFSTDPQVETFDTMCRDLHYHYDKNPEKKLMFALKAIEALSQCICILHNAELLHRDIKPSNFGFMKRQDEVLVQSICLFDINSICSVYYPNHEIIGSKGYMAPETLVSPFDNQNDIYSIGATLFSSIIVTDKTEENQFLYQEEDYDHLEELVSNSKLLACSEWKSHPKLQAQLTKILKKTLCEKENRYACVEELLVDLQTAIYYAYPFEYAKTQISKENLMYVFDTLEDYFQKVIRGNYFTKTLENDLYPPVKQDDYEENTDANHDLLMRKINEDKSQHVLLLGDGGAGKTVALKNMFRYFNEQFDYCVYIPLNKIHQSKHQTIASYLDEHLGQAWEMIQIYGKMKANDKPLRLLLDGYNEVLIDKKAIRQEFIEMMQWQNTQLIISSRIDFSSYLPQDLSYKILNLAPLKKEAIHHFLESKGYLNSLSEPMYALLSNPLMLSLYTNTKNDYVNLKPSYYPLEVNDSPKTEGQIIWNYLQSQLYRINENPSTEQLCDAFLAIEYVLPRIAYEMLVKGQMTISKKQLEDLLLEIEDADGYRYYRKHRIRPTFEYELEHRYYYDDMKIAALLLNKLSLLILSSENDQYEFFHPCFYEFFIAMYVAKQIETQIEVSVLSDRCYSMDVLKHVSDLLMEENYRPIFENGIYIKEASLSQKALDLFRHQFDKKGQNATYNLLNILNIGCNQQLYHVDFSYLDFRLCSLKGIRFTQWYEEKMIASSFKGAYLDETCFISQGHQSDITAICYDKQHIYTGDNEGVLKIWQTQQEPPVYSIDTGPHKIVDMCLDSSNTHLFILTQHVLYQMNLETKTIIQCQQTNQTYRYLRLNNEQDIEVTYDTAPLIWTKIDDAYQVTEDIPCGCAIRHPQSGQVIRSYLFGKLMVYPSLESRKPSQTIDLKEFAQGTKVTSLCFIKEGQSFMVAYGNHLMEFDSQTLEKKHHKSFNGNVNAVTYDDENSRILVGQGPHLMVLNDDFSIYAQYLGEKTNTIQRTFSLNDDLYIVERTGYIKQLSKDLKIKRMRRPSTGFNHVIIGKNGQGQDAFYGLISQGEGMPMACVSYDFSKNLITPCPMHYELNNVFTTGFPLDYDYLLFDDHLLAMDKTTEEIIKFTNHRGVYIYGCCFDDCQGNLSDDFIIRNGGLKGGCKNVH